MDTEDAENTLDGALMSDTSDTSSGKLLTSIALSLCFCALRLSVSPSLSLASDLRSSYTGPGSVVSLNFPCLPKSAMDLASRQSFFSGDGSSVARFIFTWYAFTTFTTKFLSARNLASNIQYGPFGSNT